LCWLCGSLITAAHRGAHPSNPVSGIALNSSNAPCIVPHGRYPQLSIIPGLAANQRRTPKASRMDPATNLQLFLVLNGKKREIRTKKNTSKDMRSAKSRASPGTAPTAHRGPCAAFERCLASPEFPSGACSGRYEIRLPLTASAFVASKLHHAINNQALASSSSFEFFEPNLSANRHTDHVCA